jgi:D-mannonate dehydratase
MISSVDELYEITYKSVSSSESRINTEIFLKDLLIPFASAVRLICHPLHDFVPIVGTFERMLSDIRSIVQCLEGTTSIVT